MLRLGVVVSLLSESKETAKAERVSHQGFVCCSKLTEPAFHGSQHVRMVEIMYESAAEPVVGVTEGAYRTTVLEEDGRGSEAVSRR